MHTIFYRFVFVTFIDDYSKKTYIYFMNQKSKVLDNIMIFKAILEKK